MNFLTNETIHLNTRENLLLAAFKLFAENGYNGTSTRSLCKMANANISAIPYYFNSKKGLYKELITEISYAIRSQIDIYIETVNNEQELEKDKAIIFLELFIDMFLDMLLNKEMPNNFGLIISREHLNPTEAYDILYENLFKDVFSVLCKIISTLINKNREDPLVIICVTTILGQIFSFKLFKNTLIRYLNINSLDKSTLELIKTTIKEQSKAIINSYGGNQ